MAELIDALDFESSFERSVGLKPTPVAKFEVSVLLKVIGNVNCKVSELQIEYITRQGM